MEEYTEEDKLFNELIEIKNKHRKYTIEFKLKVLKLLDNNVSIHKISDKLNIDRKIIRDWRDKRVALNNVQHKDKAFRCNRKTGPKKNFTDEEEFEISNWIIDCRKNYRPVSTKSVVSYASNLNEQFALKTINVKLRWAYRFLKRHGFAIRRVSHQGQTIPKAKSDLKSKFINEVIKIRKILNIPCDDNSRIINMDETPLFLEMNYPTTIDFIGKKNVEYLTTGREHYRISIILSVTGDGY
jgi:biotin operon repressor